MGKNNYILSGKLSIIYTVSIRNKRKRESKLISTR